METAGAAGTVGTAIVAALAAAGLRPARRIATGLAWLPGGDGPLDALLVIDRGDHRVLVGVPDATAARLPDGTQPPTPLAVLRTRRATDAPDAAYAEEAEFLQALARVLLANAGHCEDGTRVQVEESAWLRVAFRHAALVADAVLPASDAGHAWFAVVPLHADEIEAARAWRVAGIVELLRARDPLCAWDAARPSLCASVEGRIEIEGRRAEEGSESSMLRVEWLRVFRDDAGVVVVGLPKDAVETLRIALRDRVAHGRECLLVADAGALLLRPGDATAIVAAMLGDREIPVLEMHPRTARDLATRLPQTPSDRAFALRGVRIAIGEPAAQATAATPSGAAGRRIATETTSRAVRSAPAASAERAKARHGGSRWLGSGLVAVLLLALNAIFRMFSAADDTSHTPVRPDPLAEWRMESERLLAQGRERVERERAKAAGAKVTAPHTVAWEHGRPVTALAMSPDGRLVASADAAGVLRERAADTGVELAVHRGPDAAVKRILYSPDATEFVCTGPYGAFARLRAGRDSGAVRQGEPFHGIELPVGCAWTGDGTLVVRGSLSGEWAFTPDGARPIAVQRGVASLVTTAWCADAEGTRFVRAQILSSDVRLESSDKRVQPWTKRAFGGAGGGRTVGKGVAYLAFACADRVVVAASEDCELVALDAEDGAVVWRVASAGTGAAVDPTGTRVIRVGRDVVVLAANDGHELARAPAPWTDLEAWTCTPDGNALVVATDGGHIRVVPLPEHGR